MTISKIFSISLRTQLIPSIELITGYKIEGVKISQFSPVWWSPISNKPRQVPLCILKSLVLNKPTKSTFHKSHKVIIIENKTISFNCIKMRRRDSNRKYVNHICVLWNLKLSSLMLVDHNRTNVVNWRWCFVYNRRIE